jgi:hypothetical protein
MPLLVPIAPTDSFDIWRQKDNAGLNALNNQGINEIVKIILPLNDQDILVYNQTDGFFENTGISALVQSIINTLNATGSQVKPFFLSQGVRTLF